MAQAASSAGRGLTLERAARRYGAPAEVELNAPVVCTLQGEDTFLDGLPAAQREQAWQITRERARDVDRFIAPSHYFGELMKKRLQLSPERVHVVHNGINLDGFQTRNPKPETRNAPVVGYFARMCREKGLELVVDTFIELRKRGAIPNAQLHVGGGCGPSDEIVVAEQKQKLSHAGLLDAVRWFPNVTRDEKIQFMQSLDVFCTPALYGEAFGLYVIEAMAAGVPVVQPKHAAFPEIIEATGGGVIVEPNATSLSAAIEELLRDFDRAETLGEQGRRAVHERFNVTRMATETAAVFESASRLANGQR